MPRPWTPQRSMWTVSSLEVTRASKMRSRIESGTPQPSSSMTRVRASPSRLVATRMRCAPASRELRSISITTSSMQRMSCLA